MMMRFGFLMSALVVGLTILPSDGYGFDPIGRNASADCAAPRTFPCTVALVLPSEAIVLPAGAVVPVPLPRPPDLDRPAYGLLDRFCVHPADCR